MKKEKNQNDAEETENSFSMSSNNIVNEELNDKELEEMEEIPDDIQSEQQTQSEFSWIDFSKKTLFVLTFLLPIFFLPLTLYPISFNQQSLALVLTAVILIGAIFYAITRGEISLPEFFASKSLLKFSIWFLLLIFIISFTISLILSRSFNFSLWGIDGSEYDTFISLLSVIIILVASSIVLRTKNDIRKLLKIIIASSMVAIAIFFAFNIFSAIFNKPLLNFPVNGFNTVGTLGMFSAFLGLGFFATLIFLKTGIIENSRRIKPLIVSLALILLVLLSISHRPTFIALIFSMSLFIILFIHKKESIQISKLNTTILLIFIFLILNFIRIPLPSFMNLPLEVSLAHKSSFKIALSSLTSSVKNLIFGSGPNTYVFEYLKFKPSDINSSLFWNFDFRSGASFWFSILPTIGIVATLMLFFFFLSILVKAIKNFLTSSNDNDNISIALISVYFYLFVLSLFLSFNFTLLFLFAIITAALISNLSIEENRYIHLKFKEATIKNIIISFLFICVLISSLVLFALSAKRYVSYVIFGKAVYSFNKGKGIDNSISKIGLAAKFNLSEEFARNLAALWFEKLKTIVSSTPNSNMDLLKPRMQESFNNSIGAMQIAITLNPINYLYWLELGNIYERVIIVAPNSESLALQGYTMAQKLNPKNPLMFLNLARIEMIKAQNGLEAPQTAYASAEKYVQAAIKLKEDYTDAYLALSQIYEKAGKSNEAIKNLENRAVKEPRNIGLLFQLGYLKYQYGDNVGAKETFINIISMSQDYSNAKYYLGLIYSRTGEYGKAIKEFEDILKLNPGNQEVIKILNNLRAGLPAL